jgi:hypothetical protein
MYGISGLFHTSEFSCGPGTQLYNIYRDGVLIEGDWPETTYQDLAPGMNPYDPHCWVVRAVCQGDGYEESEPAKICMDMCGPSELLTIFGVVANAKEVFIEGASVAFVGVYKQYSDVTDYMGRFDIPEAYAMNYDLTITAAGYQTHTQNINITGHTNMGTITMLEIPYPPISVAAANEVNYARITWNAPVVPPKTLTGYKIFRLLNGQQDNPASWVTLTTNPVNEMYFNDYTWSNVVPNVYLWAVRTCYAGGVESAVTFSNTLEKPQPTFTVTFNVKDCASEAYLPNATIEFNGEALEGYTVIVPAGVYPYTVSLENYEMKSGEVIVTNKNVTVTVCLDEIGIANFTLGNFNLYPNPASSTITVERTAETFATIEIYNSMGMFVYKFETTEVKFEIDVTAFSAGTYFIRVTEDDVVGVKSFVKQ